MLEEHVAEVPLVRLVVGPAFGATVRRDPVRAARRRRHGGEGRLPPTEEVRPGTPGSSGELAQACRVELRGGGRTLSLEAHGGAEPPRDEEALPGICEW